MYKESQFFEVLQEKKKSLDYQEHLEAENKKLKQIISQQAKSQTDIAIQKKQLEKKVWSLSKTSLELARTLYKVEAQFQQQTKKSAQVNEEILESLNLSYQDKLTQNELQFKNLQNELQLVKTRLNKYKEIQEQRDAQIAKLTTQIQRITIKAQQNNNEQQQKIRKSWKIAHNYGEKFLEAYKQANEQQNLRARIKNLEGDIAQKDILLTNQHQIKTQLATKIKSYENALKKLKNQIGNKEKELQQRYAKKIQSISDFGSISDCEGTIKALKEENFSLKKLTEKLYLIIKDLKGQGNSEPSFESVLQKQLVVFIASILGEPNHLQKKQFEIKVENALDRVNNTLTDLRKQFSQLK